MIIFKFEFQRFVEKCCEPTRSVFLINIYLNNDYVSVRDFNIYIYFKLLKIKSYYFHLKGYELPIRTVFYYSSIHPIIRRDVFVPSIILLHLFNSYFIMHVRNIIYMNMFFVDVYDANKLTLQFHTYYSS